MTPSSEEWIQAIGCVYLVKHPRGYARQLEKVLQWSAANEAMERAWRSVEDRPVEVFVWFHKDDAEAKSIPHPGDVSIRALKTTVRVRMTSSAAWTGTSMSTAAAVAEDHRLIMQALERRYGLSLLSP